MVQTQSHNTYWYDGQGDCWREGAPGIPRSFSLLFLGCSALASESIYSCLSGKWWWAACNCSTPPPSSARSFYPTVRGTGFYGSRAVQNRINRRVSKETPTGEAVLEFGMNPHATTVRHAGIDYLPGLTWMAQELVSWESSRWKPGRKKERKHGCTGTPFNSLRLLFPISPFFFKFTVNYPFSYSNFDTRTWRFHPCQKIFFLQELQSSFHCRDDAHWRHY